LPAGAAGLSSKMMAGPVAAASASGGAKAGVNFSGTAGSAKMSGSSSSAAVKAGAGAGGGARPMGMAAAAARLPGTRTSSLTLSGEPGGPIEMRSPSERTCSFSTLSPLTNVPAALPTSLSRTPASSQAMRAWRVSTLRLVSRRCDEGPEPMIFSAPGDSRGTWSPSEAPPVTISVGSRGPLDEELICLA
jgi:hypothetical protein